MFSDLCNYLFIQYKIQYIHNYFYRKFSHFHNQFDYNCKNFIFLFFFICNYYIFVILFFYHLNIFFFFYRSNMVSYIFSFKHFLILFSLNYSFYSFIKSFDFIIVFFHYLIFFHFLTVNVITVRLIGEVCTINTLENLLSRGTLEMRNLLQVRHSILLIFFISQHLSIFYIILFCFILFYLLYLNINSL